MFEPNTWSPPFLSLESAAPRTRGCRLLVSVRDAREARLAVESGVDWIDLKEPTAGPLGAADLDTVRAVAQVLSSHDRRSAALGELVHCCPSQAREYANYFPLLKMGLSNVMADSMWRNHWRQRLDELDGELRKTGCSLVPVVYADWQQCGAPPITDIVDYAGRVRAPFLLIDTYQKNGSHLLDHLSQQDLLAIVRQLAANQCRVVLAGSLGIQQANQLSQLPVEAIGIRGAVCLNGRVNSLCEEKIKAWISEFNRGTAF